MFGNIRVSRSVSISLGEQANGTHTHTTHALYLARVSVCLSLVVGRCATRLTTTADFWLSLTMAASNTKKKKKKKKKSKQKKWKKVSPPSNVVRGSVARIAGCRPAASPLFLSVFLSFCLSFFLFPSFGRRSSFGAPFGDEERRRATIDAGTEGLAQSVAPLQPGITAESASTAKQSTDRAGPRKQASKQVKAAKGRQSSSPSQRAEQRKLLLCACDRRRRSSSVVVTDDGVFSLFLSPSLFFNRATAIRATKCRPRFPFPGDTFFPEPRRWWHFTRPPPSETRPAAGRKYFNSADG